MAAGASVQCLVVQRRAEQLGVSDAPGVCPHINGCDRAPAAVEPQESMPECRDADRPRFLRGSIRVDGVQACGDSLHQPCRVVLDAAIRCQGWRVLHLV